jgi:membrane associated rhomboid family serine protease
MDTEELVDILFSTEREHCNELALVLASQSIDAQVRWNGRYWVLRVPDEAVDAARREISAYAAEAADTRPIRPTRRPPGSPWSGVAAYLAIIVAMGWIAPDMSLDIDWLADGRMDSGRMLAGEWWRPITALSLHADFGHLLGNAFFGAFFGYSVGRYLGSGFGWLAIVLCAALGNAANALLSGSDHRSIGASTAVFGALAVLAANTWRRGWSPELPLRLRIAPIVAAVALLAYTGTGGANTDIGAHLMGFVSGLVIGLALASVPEIEAASKQKAAGIAAVALVASAWAWGLTAG